MKEYSIKEISTLLNIGKETLRYYDSVNLVKPRRKENNYRYYTQSDKDDLVCILLLKYGGFQLSEIALILENRRNIQYPNESLESSKVLIKKKKNEILMKIKSLQGIAELLESIGDSLESETDCSSINTMVNHVYDNLLKDREETTL